MPEFHFGHSGFVNFSTFHDFDFSFEVLLLFVEVRLVFIFGLEHNFVLFKLLFVSRLLLDKANFLLLVLFDSLSELGHPPLKDIFPVNMHEAQINIYFIEFL